VKKEGKSEGESGSSLLKVSAVVISGGKLCSAPRMGVEHMPCFLSDCQW